MSFEPPPGMAPADRANAGRPAPAGPPMPPAPSEPALAPGTLALENLGKAFRRYPSRWARVAEWLRPSRPRHAPLWVLRGLDLRVEPGQAVGIIGRNGAGKSTLLKLITGTSEPTEGRVRTAGRVAALLELGMGFHPDFTGRQNVGMAGQLMGWSAAEVAQALPGIEAFAEIGAYLDEPVRTYSSGMQVRLAFSVATAFRPDLLIVDEALAVGDLYFQHKCFSRLREFRAAGTTLLFVSHDPGAIKSLCDRAVLLDEGRVRADDAPDQVLDLYNALVAERENRGFAATAAPVGQARVGVRSGDRRATLEAVSLHNAAGPAQVFTVGEAMTVRVGLRQHAALQGLTVGFLIRDRVGNDVFGTNTWHVPARAADGAPGLEALRPGGAATLDWHLPALDLGPGSYTISVALHGDMTHVENSHDWWDKAARFEVVRGPEPIFEGVARLRGVEARLRVEGPEGGVADGSGQARPSAAGGPA